MDAGGHENWHRDSETAGGVVVHSGLVIGASPSMDERGCDSGRWVVACDLESRAVARRRRSSKMQRRWAGPSPSSVCVFASSSPRQWRCGENGRRMDCRCFFIGASFGTYAGDRARERMVAVTDDRRRPRKLEDDVIIELG
nr:hypothetical protein Iba_chr07bCG6700 [Ipomoea batatas]